MTLKVEEIGAVGKSPWGTLARGATASAKISRKDFDLSWNAALETGGVLVGDEIQIQLEVELNPKA